MTLLFGVTYVLSLAALLFVKNPYAKSLCGLISTILVIIFITKLIKK